MTDNSNPFARGAPIWREQGWMCTLWLPLGKKSPPPTDYTGRLGELEVSQDQVDKWALTPGNLGIRLPQGVIGIDVDWYKPDGQVSYSTLVNECGPLPATYKSSGRPLMPHSGVYLFRVDWSLELHDKPLPGIEIIQWFHRYICTWPSHHPDSGEIYRLTDPKGMMGVRPPLIDELPFLPETWLKRLVQPKRAVGVSKPLEVTGGWSKAVSVLYAETQVALSGAGRHDAMRHGVDGLTRLERSGHPGANEALQLLGGQFVAAITSDGTRTPGEAHSELQRLLDGARDLIESTPSYRPSYDQLKSQRTPIEGPPVANPDDGSPQDPLTRALARFQQNHHRGNALNDIKPLTPIVEGLLDLGTLAVVLGEPGSGKSQIVIDLSAHVVLGRNWCGRETRAGKVVYFVGEGQYGIRQRVAAWCSLHEHTGPPQGDGLEDRPLEVPIDWVTVSPNLMDLQFDTLAALQFVYDQQPSLVVIDTLNRALPGGDENSPQDMGKIILFAERVRELCGATTLYVHHLGKDATRGARGHSSLNGAADTVLLVKPAGDSLRQLHLEKQKDHPDDYDLWFQSRTAAGSIAVIYDPKGEAPAPASSDIKDLTILRQMRGLNGGRDVKATDLVEACKSLGKGYGKSEVYVSLGRARERGWAVLENSLHTLTETGLMAIERMAGG